MSDEMSFEELMSLESRLRRAEVGGGEQESLGRALPKVQAHVNAAPPSRSARWGRRLSMFAIVGIPATAAAAIAGIVLLNGHPTNALVPVPAATPTVDLTPVASPPGLTCDLPVATSDFALLPPYIRGAFMKYPGGAITPDPASEIVMDDTGAHMKLRPGIKGDSSVPSYDAATHQWLPVRPEAISADGSKYAWVENQRYANPGRGIQPAQPVHVVDVVTGADRVVYASGQFDGPTWMGTTTIYLVHHVYGSDSTQGLYRIDTGTGQVTPITTTGTNWQFVQYDSAWSSSGSAIPGKLPGDSIVNLNVSNGQTSSWFTRPGKSVAVIGIDPMKRPLVTVTAPNATGAAELWRLDSPTDATQLAPATDQYATAWSFDRQGTWVRSGPPTAPQDWGISRLDLDGRLVRLATTAGLPAGACR